MHLFLTVYIPLIKWRSYKGVLDSNNVEFTHDSHIRNFFSESLPNSHHTFSTYFCDFVEIVFCLCMYYVLLTWQLIYVAALKSTGFDCSNSYIHARLSFRCQNAKPLNPGREFWSWPETSLTQFVLTQDYFLLVQELKCIGIQQIWQVENDTPAIQPPSINSGFSLRCLARRHIDIFNSGHISRCGWETW